MKGQPVASSEQLFQIAFCGPSASVSGNSFLGSTEDKNRGGTTIASDIVLSSTVPF